MHVGITVWATADFIGLFTYFENEQRMHRHAYDYFGLELTDSKTDTVSPEGDARSVSTSRGLAWFLAKGVTHVEIGRSSNPPRHAIIVELKNAASPDYRNTTAFPTAFSADGDRKIVDDKGTGRTVTKLA